MSASKTSSIDYVSWPHLDYKDGPRYIRVLNIEPMESDRKDDSLRCTLRRACLDDPGEYEALSYAWGFEKTTERIFINGFAFPVSLTLKSALLRIRQQWDSGMLLWEGRRPKLWLDAICINQSDLDEKSKQVALMGSIYKAAKSVLVWLGEPDNEMDTETARLLACRDGTGRSSDSDFLAARLTSKPWFSRRWVVQEVISNEACWGLLGEDLFPMSALIECLDRLSSSAWSWRPSKSAPERNLLGNLIVCNRTSCSNDLDRVYALLGLSSDASLLTVNYRLNYLQVFSHVASYYLRTNLAPVLLVCAVTFRPPVRPVSYRSMPRPSWVPDWRSYDSASFRFGTSKPSIEQLFPDLRSFVRALPWLEDGAGSDIRWHARFWKSVESAANSKVVDVIAWMQPACEHVESQAEAKCLHCNVCNILRTKLHSTGNIPAALEEINPSGKPVLRMPDIYCFVGYAPVIFGLFRTGLRDGHESYTLGYFFILTEFSSVDVLEPATHNSKYHRSSAFRIGLTAQIDGCKGPMELEMTQEKLCLV